MLLLLASEGHAGPGNPRTPFSEANRSVLSAHFGEDYSVCQWPIVVKAQHGYSAEYVADRLEDMAAYLRRHGWDKVLGRCA